MKLKKIILGVLVLAILGAFIAYKSYNKPHVNVANEKTDISVTADEILSNFSSEEAAANIKYLGKIVQVKGIVSMAEVANGKGIITLQTNDDFGSVLCHVTADELEYTKEIKGGQELVLKGICTGFLMDVILVKCIILKQK